LLRRVGAVYLGRPAGGSLSSGRTDRGAELVPREATPEEELEPTRAFPAVNVLAMGIWSSGDEYLTEEGLIGSGDHVTGPWRYERIERAGHWLQLDAPDGVNKLLLDFLA
jgi:pimeloyl-ACP methyl ester carboxylesterase